MTETKRMHYGIRKKGTKRQFLKQHNIRKPYLHLALLNVYCYTHDDPVHLNELFLTSYFYTYDPEDTERSELNIEIPMQNKDFKLNYDDFEIVGYYSERIGGSFKYIIDESTRKDLLPFKVMKIMVCPNYTQKTKDHNGLDEFKHELMIIPAEITGDLIIKNPESRFWEVLPPTFINQERDWTLKQTFMLMNQKVTSYLFYHDETY